MAHLDPSKDLTEVLRKYRMRHPEEAETLDRVSSLLGSGSLCLERTGVPGHVTASAWIIDAGHEHFLLTHHRKLGRWLQLGGHVDGDVRVHLAALREAREESGLRGFDLALIGGEIAPIDLDVHAIPALGLEPEHWHHDFRFLFRAHRDQAILRSDESFAVQWFPRSTFEELIDEASTRRLAAKAWLLADDPGTEWLTFDATD